MIKNIIFDLGNVVFEGKSSSVLKKLNASEEVIEEIRAKFFKNYTNLDLGDETLEQHFYNSGLSVEEDEYIKDFLINYYKYRNMNVGIVELIHKLKEQDYGVYVLSNNNKEASQYIMGLPELQCIDGWVISCDCHSKKPDEKIYFTLFEKYNLKPDECFFVDDKEHNIKAGELLGMKGHVLNYEEDGAEELIKDLKQNGVEI
ncbi:MAG: HAD-IA family hydrolase [Clostridia bacterium]|nr:HAD-IA family hydrolase [Clostridia bacterium]